MSLPKTLRNRIIYAAIALIIILFAGFVWHANHPQPTFPQSGIWFCPERNSYIQFNVTESAAEIHGCEVFEPGGIQIFHIEFNKDGRTLYFVDRTGEILLIGTIEYRASRSPTEFQIIESQSHKRYRYVLTDLGHIMNFQRF